MALAHQYTFHTADEYLSMEAEATVKHEYVAGEIYAMAGASERHNRIVGNAFFHIRTATRGKTCGVFMADMKLRLMTQNIFYYPDVMLVCDRDDDHPLYKTAPCILVEVLSSSTATTDKREKWFAYRSLPSLKAYLLVDSEIRRAEYYLREEAGEWQHASLEENDVLNLVCGDIRLALTLDDLYEDVDVPVI
jgi:Uma2 family endonuclease